MKALYFLSAVFFGILTAVCFLGGVAGGICTFLYCLVWAITDAVNLINGTYPVTFGNVFHMVAMFFLREIAAALVVFVSWFAGLGCLALTAVSCEKL